MYMTRVVLKRVPPANIIHGVLSAAFPGKRSDKTNENLWRVDNFGDNSALLIVSVKTPELSHIVKEIGVGDERNKTLDYVPFLERIECGHVWNFRLCANPVEHKKKDSSDKRGKVYALRSSTEQIEWIKKQCEKYGFNVKGCSIIGDEWKILKPDKNNGKNTVSIRAVTFEGVLVVTDADIFREALTRGIGRGKAYGCGLLTIAGVQT